ncbi:MAG: DPP IV N-terminal domain-containing protein [Planctomycetota bacterium]|jgi:Tol biopolymer transport system component
MNRVATIPVLLIVLLTSASARVEAVREAQQHFEKANELLKHMDYEAAIAEYSKVIDLSSSSKIAQDAQYWIGQSHFRAGQFDAARATFAKLIETYPTSTIVPVTKLMVERVARAKENEQERRVMSDIADKGFIIHPRTGVRYTKIAAFAGKNDVIEYNTDLNLSPNGKFLLFGKLVVPADGSEPFDLVDTPAYRGVWSPGGKKVAFYSGDAICVVPVSPDTGRPTGTVRKLLEGDYKWHTTASWSPDSENLAFLTMPDEEKGIHGGDIWAVSVRDGSLRQIATDPEAKEEAPAWSPDGKTIAYARRKGRQYSLWLVSAEGGAPRKTIEPGGRFVPFWSPDGKWILCRLGRELHLFDIHDNRQLEIILPARVVGDFFSWSPDGRKILFYLPSYNYLEGLKVVSASGGMPLDVAGQIPCYGTAVWSSDSKTIAVQGGDENGNVVIWIMPLSDHNPVPVKMDVEVGGRPFPFSVSPEAKKIAFVVDREDRTQDLYVAPISLPEARTTGPAVRIFDKWHREGAFNVMASWSPEGNRLAVIHKRDIWIASSNGDKPVQLTKTQEMGNWPGWSPDGKMVSYEITQQHLRSLYAIPVSGGKGTKILDFPGNRRYAYGWSPDSKKLVTDSEGMISVVSLADGAIQKIANLKDIGLDGIFRFSWSPDSKFIAFVGNHIEKGGAGPIYVIPVEGGDVTTLVTDDDSGKYLSSWSPDGKWLAYSSERTVKVRPEGTMWEADFDEILKEASHAD